MNTHPAIRNDVIEVIPVDLTAGTPDYYQTPSMNSGQTSAQHPQSINPNHLVGVTRPNETVTITQTTTVTRQGSGYSRQPEMVEVPLRLAEWIGITIFAGVVMVILVGMVKVAFS